MNRLPDDRDLEQTVRSWMRDDDDHPADRNRQVGRVMGRVDETRQRRRRWLSLPFRHRTPAVDEHDDDLVALGGDVAARGGRIAPALMAAVAVIALLATGLLYTTFRPTDPVAAPGMSAGSGSPEPGSTWLPVDEEDEALFDRVANVWANDAIDVAEVMEVYASDAVHTALWTDRVQRFIGSNAIANRIMQSENLGSRTLQERWRIEDGPGGEHRYLSVVEDIGDMACVWWVKDGRITRHDCILPMSEEFGELFAPGEPPSDVSREDLQERLAAGWAGDRGAMESAVEPEVIHYVAFNDHAVVHKGIDEYEQVASQPGMPPPTVLAPAIDLAAPEGELRWTDFSDVGGGTLCTFWARGDKVIRHDCIVPAYTSNNPPPEEPGT